MTLSSLLPFVRCWQVGAKANGGIRRLLVEEINREDRGGGAEFASSSHIFRSDLHAEMDLLTCYEERLKACRNNEFFDTHGGSSERLERLVLLYLRRALPHVSFPHDHGRV